jgi:type IV pilus assembly protein PilM
LPIGIDLGTAYIKLAQMRQAGRELELVNASSAPVPPAVRNDRRKLLDYAGGEIRRMLSSGGFVGRKCILALPAALTYVQHVKAPRLGQAELHLALRDELAGKLPFNAADAVIRHIVVGEVYEKGAGLEVIAVAAQRQAVDAHLEMAGRCRLEVVGINIEPCAILECFARLFRRQEDAARATAFLDLGQSNTQVVISHGARLVFARNLMVGASDLEQAASVELKIPPQEVAKLRQALGGSIEPSEEAGQLLRAMQAALEPLVGQITQCLRYYESIFPSKGVERAVFLGGSAQDRRLCQHIAQQLNLPAQIGDPLARVRKGAAGAAGGVGQGLTPAYAVAVGLSLGSATPAQDGTAGSAEQMSQAA